jgi:hypothetical protein
MLLQQDNGYDSEFDDMPALVSVDSTDSEAESGDEVLVPPHLWGDYIVRASGHTHGAVDECFSELYVACIADNYSENRCRAFMPEGYTIGDLERVWRYMEFSDDESGNDDDSD